MREREDVRARHRRLRREMTEEQVRDGSGRICERLWSAPWYAECRILYGYYPLGQEVDCRSLLARALSDGKQVALPRMEPGSSSVMHFYRVASLSEVARGAYQIMEPVADAPRVEETQAVVLVPGVAFDRQGNRYGYGKGCYDRYFARFPQLYRVGLAYENQMEEHLTTLRTDVRMDAVCTEQQLWICGRERWS